MTFALCVTYKIYALLIKINYDETTTIIFFNSATNILITDHNNTLCTLHNYTMTSSKKC